MEETSPPLFLIFESRRAGAAKSVSELTSPHPLVYEVLYDARHDELTWGDVQTFALKILGATEKKAARARASRTS